MGPVVSEGQYKRVLSYIKIATDEGARLVTGGGRPSGASAKGYFIAPTVFADVKPTMRVWKEEVFGPVRGECLGIQDLCSCLIIAEARVYHSRSPGIS